MKCNNSPKTAQFDKFFVAELQLPMAGQDKIQSTKLRHRRFACKSLLVMCWVTVCLSTQAAVLESHFRFDGNLFDQTFKHNGTMVNSNLTPTFVPGTNGNALQVPLTTKKTLASSNASPIFISVPYRKAQDLRREPAVCR